MEAVEQLLRHSCGALIRCQGISLESESPSSLHQLMQPWLRRKQQKGLPWHQTHILRSRHTRCSGLLHRACAPPPHSVQIREAEAAHLTAAHPAVTARSITAKQCRSITSGAMHICAHQLSPSFWAQTKARGNMFMLQRFACTMMPLSISYNARLTVAYTFPGRFAGFLHTPNHSVSRQTNRNCIMQAV